MGLFSLRLGLLNIQIVELLTLIAESVPQRKYNVADMYVTFSTAILVIQVLFVYKENDFNFLSFKQKKFRELK